MPYVPLGTGTNFAAINAPTADHSWSTLLGGTSVGRVFILAGGTQGIIRSENYDGAGGISTATTGWALFGDGTVFLGSGATLGADLYSSNWDGTIPAVLSSKDGGATAGYYLDYSLGAAQFMGSMWVDGTLTATAIVATGTINATGGSITGLLSMSSAGDIKANWNGASPANLATADGTATTGYYLDGSVGAGQFQTLYAEGGSIENLSITGTLTMSGGEIVTDSAVPRWRIADSSSDASVLTNVLEFEYAAADYLNPKLAVSADSIGMYARDNSAGADQAAILLRRDDLNTQARVQLTLDQGYNNDSAWLEIWDVGDSVKGFELAGGTDWSATNLGSGEQFIRLWNKGDGGTVGIYGNPVAAEHLLYVADGNPASESLKFAVNSDGPMGENALTVFPSRNSAAPAQVTTFASSATWITTPSTTITLWTHSGTNRPAEVTGWARFTWGETGAVSYTGECKIQVSTDGGSTWTDGVSSLCYVGTGTGGAGYRSDGMVLFQAEFASGSVTGDIQMRLQHKVSNTAMDRLHNIHIMGIAEQLF